MNSAESNEVLWSSSGVCYGTPSLWQLDEVEWLGFLLCIPKVPSSILNPEAGYSDLFVGFPKPSIQIWGYEKPAFN
jgi:hypothetical protein